MIFGYTDERLKELGASFTAKEIFQQPKLWKETYEIIKGKKEEIDRFFGKISAKHARFRVVLTGAGSSAFIGQTISPYLNKVVNRDVDIDAIATTDIVSNPTYFLKKDEPTVMISFARSGDSPESVAAVELGEQIVQDFYHIALTCNPEGNLAKKCEGGKNTLLILLPVESNDQGFAMTGSFTSMMLGAILIFDRKRLNELKEVVSRISNIGESVIIEREKQIDEIIKFPFRKVVYLGSGVFYGIAREASLKILELTGGKIPVTFDSPLGFRHGPKSVIDEDTLIVVFLSNNEYTRKYELDILREINNSDLKTKLVAISDFKDQEAEELCDFLLINQEVSSIKEDDVYLVFPYILYAQLLAFKKSIQLGFNPDNPSPNGIVNRVVKGVTIYSF